MTRRKGSAPSNVAHSVKARLLQRARRDGEDFNSLLIRYVLERLLYRLAGSAYANEFVLKGALLFVVWSNQPHRATKDLDLLGSGPPDLARLAQIFRDIAGAAVPDDGVIFRGETIVADPSEKMLFTTAYACGSSQGSATRRFRCRSMSASATRRFPSHN